MLEVVGFIIGISICIGVIIYSVITLMSHSLDTNCTCDSCKEKEIRDTIRRRAKYKQMDEIRRAVDEMEDNG